MTAKNCKYFIFFVSKGGYPSVVLSGGVQTPPPLAETLRVGDRPQAKAKAACFCL